MLFFLSITYIEQKKLVKYILLNILAVLFHASAIIYMPMYFILNKHYSKTIVFAFFILGNIFYLLQIEWCKAIFWNMRYVLPGRLGGYIHIYFDSKSKYSQNFGITIGYLERFLSFVLIFFFEKKLVKDKGAIIFINLFYIYSFIYLYFSEISIILERVPLLFIGSYWILYPFIYRILNNKNKKLFLFLLMLYGILKIGYENRRLASLYENALFLHQSYYERADLIRGKL
jgi:hypothetical protein